MLGWFPIQDASFVVGGVHWNVSYITFAALMNIIVFTAKNLYVVYQDPNLLAVLNSSMMSKKVSKYALLIFEIAQVVRDYLMAKLNNRENEKRSSSKVFVDSTYHK